MFEEAVDEVRRSLTDAEGHVDAELAEALRVTTTHLGLSLGIVSRVVGDDYFVEHFHAPEGALARGQRFDVGKTYCQITLAADDLVTIDQMAKSEHQGHPCYAAFGLESYIGVPLRVHGETVGTLNFSSPDVRPIQYGAAEQGLVKLTASWVERTLERRQLLLDHLDALHARAKAESVFRAFFEHSPDGILLHRDGKVLSVNRALLSVLGYDAPDDIIGRPLMEFLPREQDRERSIERLARLSRGEHPGPPHELACSRRDGEIVWLEATGVTVELQDGRAAMSMFRDLTERRQTQQRLMQSERLASVGTLAAGVAHELNNPLAYVVANVDVALEELDDIMGPSPSKRLVELHDAVSEAKEGARRARKIVRDLRTFSRVDEEARAPQDLHRLLEIAASMTANEIRHRATLVKDYGRIPSVWGDESRLTQVFVNLLMNAAQAIPAGAASENTVTVRTRALDDGRVEAIVEDTGPGISEAILSRIFDPFYTTKPVGEGTGLGLPTSHSIVEGLGGELVAENHEHGARFRVTLSAATHELEVAEKSRAGSFPPPTAARGRLLIIDDDPMVGRSLKRVLGRAHDVTFAQGGDVALEMLAKDRAYDAILCDLMMPTVPGWAVFARVRELDPGLASRIVFITGGTLGTEGRRFLERVPNHRMGKPFDMNDLRSLVAAMVKAQRRSDSSEPPGH